MGDVRRLIAFDLDGTLIDSRRDLANAANQLLEELGATPLSEEAIGRMVGEGARVLVERAIAAAGLQTDLDAALSRFLSIYDMRLLDHTVPYDGMLDVLRHARERARLAVLTNKPRRPSVTILDALGLSPFFDDVVGGDGPYGRKPDPRGLQALMRDAGATRETTLMIGDSAIDHETALRAATPCCLTAYGYGFLMFPRQRLTGAESIVSSPGELRDVVDRFVRAPGQK